MGLFTPFRAIGYVTSDVPVSIQARGQSYFLTTSIGNSFQIYDMAKMGLLFVGPQTPAPITAILSHGDLTFAACGSGEIIVYERAKEIDRWTSPNSTAEIVQLCIFGDLLLAICDDNVLRIWNHAGREYYNELSFGPGFRATSIIHPSTYLNKILVGSQQGELQLWNIRTMKLIYEFPTFESSITYLAQSPVVDVVAIGLLDGTTVIHNIRYDEEIMRFKQDGKVTAISFRTDDKHIMATANMSGDIALWDLDQRKLAHTMKGAHDGNVTTIQYLNGQPVLVTAGTDNSIKQWIFDNLDGQPRVLRSRSGHHQPPTLVRHYGPDGHILLTAGRDRSLRMYSIIRDAQNCELSQGSLEKKSKLVAMKIDELKLPQIIQIAASEAKEKEWDNIITAHSGEYQARTWEFQRKAIGKHLLATTDGSFVKSVAISSCGNFGYVGSTKGLVDMYNLQSGLHRRTFGGSQGHTRAVVGILTDNVNQVLITGSLDGTVKIWSVPKGHLIGTVQLETPVSLLTIHKESGLVAVSCDDLCIRVMDIETRKIVREFWGHRNRVTDLTFSPDARWLVSTSLDGTIRTWDLPTGYLIDCFKVANVATSVSFSPKGDFLSTTHVDHVGVFLWSNRMMFSNISLRNLNEEDVDQVLVALPTAAKLDDTIHDDEDAGEPAKNDEQDEGQTDDELLSLEAITDKMIMLSTLPKSRWQNLLNLEAIKKRNKPAEAPKQPEKAPFFLPTLPGVTTKFDFESATKDRADDTETRSHVLKLKDINPTSHFAEALKAGHLSNDYSQFIDFVKTLSPSSIDFELRTLSPEDDHAQFVYLLRALRQHLEKRRDFELIEAYLGAFLKIHGDVMVSQSDNESLQLELQLVKEEHQRTWGVLESQLHYALCLVQFAKGS
ncbi:Utp21 specific WD40 associated putative domain-containing protein [Polychytrium aggregatum]|uniref:Utp21 specific WD40 associated putative domain-containing protein n=1 Tax=Polychytrium aggregatum TaxID=110093 RepID=UPI0022FE340F|nr:Utp21 specific WD40 associated putative domain-containing protein [Polychytrium aggregatum]KAI9205039.1 Utp21 specific WD40 associated putative domain-containing protein [Polychytrium aggregatum]